jgi:catechol 2,3-dioxygenase-like lactoylglutathione lyase family enzyme
MGFHHTALATKDLMGTYEFYTKHTGFELVKVVVGPTESEGGWAKHLFFEMSPDEYIAFWDLHDESLKDWSPAISTSQKLPVWVNHLAFRASDLDDIAKRRARWLEHGHDVMEIDHGWCTSIYTVDPNGILVEFCTTTQAMTQADKDEALRLLMDPKPPLESPPPVRIHKAKKAA